jgi:ribosomal protein S12 methylthiotransferase accessory factor YcaO
VRFNEIPSFAADDLTEDLQWALSCLRAVGIARAVAVNLTWPAFAIPVVRLVIPGLEWDPITRITSRVRAPGKWLADESNHLRRAVLATAAAAG